MSIEQFIPLNQLCTHYKVELSFFTNLNEIGLIEITSIEESLCIHQDKINDIEKIIRMHRELDLNFEGIDIVLNLLEKINDLQIKLINTKNRLRLYEDESM